MFLSHDWGTGRSNHIRVKRVAEALCLQGYRVWLDEWEMPSGTLRSQMVKGITDSKLFVVFVTSNYESKVNGPDAARDNCRYEFDYGYDLRGSSRTIPVVLEPDMKDQRMWVGGSLRAALGNHMYVDLTSDVPVDFARGVEALCAQARHLLSMPASAHAPLLTPPTSGP